MPLEPIPRMMARAQEGQYAVGYFESWNLESLQGVIDAAEQTRSPVIIGFNGEFLSHAERRVEERLALYGQLGREAAQSAKVPCGFIFNECPDDSQIRAAVTKGFNLVMPSDPGVPYESLSSWVKDIAAFAHARDVAVESELGVLPWGIGEVDNKHGTSTDPTLAARFVRETGVDLLAVSVGNVHVMLGGRAELDLERLSAINEQVVVPLVLHGGSGIADESLSAALALGIAKVNYGTYLKQRYLDAVRKALSTDCENPHELIGMGGENDILVAGRVAVMQAVIERLPTLKCAGRAE